MIRHRSRSSSCSLDWASRNVNVPIRWRSLNRLPLPHRTVPQPKGDDLDFVNVAHSHLLHSDWDKLDLLSSGLNPFRIKSILLKIQKDYVLSLEFFNWITRKKPASHTLDSHAIILHILTNHRKFKSAESIMKKLVRLDPLELPPKLFEALLYTYRICHSSVRVFDCLFKLYAQMKKVGDANFTFFQMKNYGFLPNVKSCNTYISSLLDLERTDIALAFYKDMQRYGISPNVYTLNMVMSALCKVGKAENALVVFEKMKSFGLSPNSASYNTLISGYCSLGAMSSATKLKSSMAADGVELTVVTYNTLIHGLCKDRKLGEANRLFTEMKNMGIMPDTVAYNTIIQGYSQMGNSQMGRSFLEEMSCSGVKPNILTYNALILGLCKEGKMKKAADLVRRLEKEKMTPNASTFTALICGQHVRRNSDRAFQLYEIMIRNGYHPNINTYELLISTFCKNNDYIRAVEGLRDMIRRRIAPLAGMLSEVCSVLSRSGKDGVAVTVCKELEATRLLPEHFDAEKIYKCIPQCLTEYV